MNQMSLNQQGPNFCSVTIGPLTVWFSYSTPIAYMLEGAPVVVRENVWGPTTGKHMNAVDGGSRTAKAARISGDDFTIRLDAITGRLGQFAMVRL